MKEIPFSSIIDDNLFEQRNFRDNQSQSCDIKIHATQIFAGKTQKDVGPKGLVIDITLKFPGNEEFTYKLIPDNEFITELVSSKILHFATSSGVMYFQIRIKTNPIENVWMPSES